jgi:hypothetical protein
MDDSDWLKSMPITCQPHNNYISHQLCVLVKAKLKKKTFFLLFQLKCGFLFVCNLLSVHTDKSWCIRKSKMEKIQTIAFDKMHHASLV